MQLLRNIKSGLIATVAVGLAVMQANGEIVHVTRKGETIYGIANMYNVTPDALLRANPQAQTGVKKGMPLVIPSGDSSNDTPQPAKHPRTPRSLNSTTETTRTESLTYLSSEGDSFETISRKTGVETGNLMELNPFLDPYDVPAGTLVRLSADAPVLDESQPMAQPQDNRNETEDLPFENAAAIRPGDVTVCPEDTDSAEAIAPAYQYPQPSQRHNILIMLPFMSESDAQSKKAQLYADFYRGFLLAAKDKTDEGMRDIDIIVTDTNDNIITSSHDINSYIDHDVAVIIAPEDHEQIQMLADSAASRGVYVLNMFNFSDDTYLASPWVIQGNINHTLMYSKAIDALLSKFSGYVPVILNAKNSREEKTAFTDNLKARCYATGKEIIEINFDEALEDYALAVLDPNKKYVFIPRSGSQTVFNRIAPAILDLMDQPGGTERFALFGYPDWTAYRGESLALLQRLRATVYSRFACNDMDADNQQMQEEFINWYGEPMLETVPSQAMLGYDVCNYLIDCLQSGDFASQLATSEQYSGLQSTFSFEKGTHDGGYVNTALYLIEFLPDDRYSIKVL